MANTVDYGVVGLAANPKDMVFIYRNNNTLQMLCQIDEYTGMVEFKNQLHRIYQIIPTHDYERVYKIEFASNLIQEILLNKVIVKLKYNPFIAYINNERCSNKPLQGILFEVAVHSYFTKTSGVTYKSKLIYGGQENGNEIYEFDFGDIDTLKVVSGDEINNSNEKGSRVYWKPNKFNYPLIDSKYGNTFFQMTVSSNHDFSEKNAEYLFRKLYVNENENITMGKVKDVKIVWVVPEWSKNFKLPSSLNKEGLPDWFKSIKHYILKLAIVNENIGNENIVYENIEDLTNSENWLL